jgi:hypothetical protein
MDVILSDTERSEGESKNLRLLFLLFGSTRIGIKTELAAVKL